MINQSRIQVSRPILALTALQVCIPVALGNLAAILGNHPGWFLMLLALATLAVVAADVRAFSPQFRLCLWEVGIFISSVVMGIIFCWAAFALFEVGFFTPFILGLGDRGLEDVGAYTSMSILP